MECEKVVEKEKAWTSEETALIARRYLKKPGNLAI